MFADKQMRSILPLLIVIVTTGCAGLNPSKNELYPIPEAERILLLDNSGGYSHLGRRIELFRDGSAIDTRYTDAIGHQSKSFGGYTLGGKKLTLRFGDRGNQSLIRVLSNGEIYWVYPNEVEDVRNPRNMRLRETSLKQKGEQGAPADSPRGL